MKTPRISSVRVPDEEQGVFLSLARLTNPALEGLEQALVRATPTLDKQKLVAQLREEPALSEVKDLTSIVGALVSVVGTAYSQQATLDDFVDILLDTIASDEVLDISDAEVQLLKERLKRLTKNECLEVVAKGNVLLRANDQNFRSARIVSDIRPICSGDEPKVAAGIILHQLAIKASHDGSLETIYFTLDSDDLISLSGVVNRAIKKDESLREFASRSATPILIPPAEE